MEFLNALTTPNPELIKYLLIPLYFIDAWIVMLLFTTILNFRATSKQKIAYFLLFSTLSMATKLFMPLSLNTLGIIINLSFSFLIIYLVFKEGLLKSLLATIIPSFLISPVETIVFLVLYNFAHISLENIQEVPIYRLFAMGIIYLTLYIIYRVIKHFHFKITILQNMKKIRKNALTTNIIFAAIILAIQFYLVYYYSSILPIFVSVLSIVSLLAYFIVTFYSLHNTTKLEIATRDIERLELYNKTLTILQDSLRTFRHDFGNILQSIGGYVNAEDLAGLEEYYSELLDDFKKVNNLSTLNPEVINSPSVFGILASKYHKADGLGIKINLEVFMDLNTINMKIYEFTKILGILLDNAIEASKECEDKIINITIRKDIKKDLQLLIIQNSYLDKDLDTLEIFDKNYSTKEGNSGLGLWEVNQILRKNKNLSLFTTKDDNFFTQQLEIYK